MLVARRWSHTSRVGTSAGAQPPRRAPCSMNTPFAMSLVEDVTPRPLYSPLRLAVYEAFHYTLQFFQRLTLPSRRYVAVSPRATSLYACALRKERLCLPL